MTGVGNAMFFVSSAQVYMEGGAAAYTAFGADDATVGVEVNSDGFFKMNESIIGAESYANQFQWKLQGAAGDYEVRATLDSGSLTSGTTGSWLACSTTRTWVRQRTANGTSSAQLTIEIRRVSDSVVVGTGVWTLDATVEP